MPEQDVAEMKSLMEEYKIRAVKFAEKASFMESKVAELRIEHEVALKRAMVAEKELIHLRKQHYANDLNLDQARVQLTEAEKREAYIKKKFDVLFNDYSKELPFASERKLTGTNKFQARSTLGLLEKPIIDFDALDRATLNKYY